MIGLIFGETFLPQKILINVKKKRVKHLIIDLTRKQFFKNKKNSYSVNLGQFGKIIKILKENKCKTILFAGKVNKPNFSKLRLDLKGMYYIPRIIKSSRVGDAAILKEIIEIFKKEGIKTIDSTKFIPELVLKKGNHTIIKPNRLDKMDITRGIKKLKGINNYDHTQGVIVRDKKVVAIEDNRGTQKMLKEFKNKKLKKSGVLVKFPKRKQDLRIDLPTIGFETLIGCKKAGLKGIVLKNNQNIFLDKRKCINFANKNKMFILAK